MTARTAALQLEKDRSDRLRAIGRAIRNARGEVTQAELGERLEPFLGESSPQTTISRWEKGIVSIDLEQLRAIELALKKPAGSLFHEAGYVPVSISTREVEAVLRADPNLDDSIKDSAVASYRASVSVSKEIRTARGRGRRR